MKNLGYAKACLAPFVRGTGLCKNDPRVVADINEAIEVLSNKPDLTTYLTYRKVRFCVYGNEITLPREVGKIISARIAGTTSARVFSRWYEFLENGPGNAETDDTGYNDFIDRGITCTQYDIPDTLKASTLMVVSDKIEAADAWIRIRGLDETAREVYWQGQIGELLYLQPSTVNPAIGGVISNNKFSRITAVEKSPTLGYVYLSAINLEVGTNFSLSVYHPDEQYPEYRRYAVKGWNYDCDAEKQGTLIDALVQMKPIALSHDSDVLLIQNMSALKKMVQSINYYDTGEPEKGTAYEAIAEKLMLEEAANFESQDDTLNFQMAGWIDSESTQGGLI